MVLLEINNEFLKLTKRSWVRNGCIPNEQRWIFFVGNERFSLLLGTNNTLRIFMVLSETKSALVTKISQRYCLLTVWNSYLLVFVSSGDLTFFSGDIAKISGNMSQVSGDMTSGEMTLGQLDGKPSCQCCFISASKVSWIGRLFKAEDILI